MDEEHRPLPTGVFDLAMRTHLAMQERRVLRMYNRVRALFAESLVVSLLPGASLVEDPAAAWDIDWPVAGRQRPARIQVKCSGERLPRLADPTLDHRAATKWDVPTPKVGFDPVTGTRIAEGHACELFVLARHEGWDIGAGWSFWALTPDRLAGQTKLRPKTLEALGAGARDAEHLAETALEALCAL